MTDAKILVGPDAGAIVKGYTEGFRDPASKQWKWEYKFVVQRCNVPGFPLGIQINPGDYQIIGTPHDINGDEIGIEDIIAVAFSTSTAAVLEFARVTKIQDKIGRGDMKKIQIVKIGKKPKRQTIEPADRVFIVKKHLTSTPFELNCLNEQE